MRRRRFWDDETDFALLQRVMPEYEIHVETRVAMALAVALQLRPDVFLIDVVLLDIDGRVLARAIRRDRRFKKIPIVFVSVLVHFSEECDEPVLIEEFPAFGKPFRIEAPKRCIEQPSSRRPLSDGRLAAGVYRDDRRLVNLEEMRISDGGAAPRHSSARQGDRRLAGEMF